MNIKQWLSMQIDLSKIIAIIATMLAVVATIASYRADTIISYGDAESHLNIAKRVVHSITPGFAQLGGIWLPIPHLMLLPFVAIEPLYRSGLAGSIVSGFSYVISTVFLYKSIKFLTKSNAASCVAALIFALNPNILYMQSTPMTELPLIMFFTLASYFTIRFIHDTNSVLDLFLAALFGFCATLSRYDGWFLVIFQAAAIVFVLLKKNMNWKKLEGLTIMFCTLAFSGILGWFLWDYLILGDPLYFTNSQFSAKSQQNNWAKRGELPAYHNLPQAIMYYTVTAGANTGNLLLATSVIGVIVFLVYNRHIKGLVVITLLFVPWIFYVITLYLGQSVIFIPELTPTSFEWNLFNVRYGIMMVPFVAFFCAYLFFKLPLFMKPLIVVILLVQTTLFATAKLPIVTVDDGTIGLSHAKRPTAEGWVKENYDDGIVLLDDYARTVSAIRTNIPMQNIVYIGNKPYWVESLKEPEKYATWIIMQKDDTVWRNIFDNQTTQDRLYAHFEKVYTSEEILIFKKKSQSVVLCLEISSCPAHY
ncbi:MAG: glycosyltransferase family 39 protein [bacterium]|nr:glycosyltransferase family 39 protein [bacterium]